MVQSVRGDPYVETIRSSSLLGWPTHGAKHIEVCSPSDSVSATCATDHMRIHGTYPFQNSGLGTFGKWLPNRGRGLGMSRGRGLP